MTSDEQRLDGELDGELDDDATGNEPVASVAEVVAGIAAETTALAFEQLRALSEPGDETVAAFITLWPAVTAPRRREVLASLQQLADDDPTLDFHRVHLSALRDDDAATRILAVRGLWEQDRVEYMRLLIDQLLDDAEATVRAAVADALGKWVVSAEFGLLSEDDADYLASTLREVMEKTTEEDEVRARALEALGASSLPSVAEAIGEAYEAGTLRMRLASLRAMGRNAHDEWLPVLLYNLDDEDMDIRAAAAIASGQLLIESAIDPLAALLEDEEQEVQLAAIGAIGEIGGGDAERILTALLGRGEQWLAEAAEEALAGARALTADFIDEGESDQ